MTSRFLQRRTSDQPYGGATMDDVIPHLLDYQLLVMLEASEDHWCAGWMSGLEDMMWDGSMRDMEASVLCRKLATITGYWYRWDDEKIGAVPVPLEEWVASRQGALGGVIDRERDGA